ncbi:MAG: M4 family metallopeptidase [Thermoleophilia bacterium]|nr:M4 family metallopeptidase [Thermoleophilia bacterium]
MTTLAGISSVGGVGTSPTSPASDVPETPNRATYDAKNSEFPKGGLGDLVRKEGDAPTGDEAIDAAHDNAGLVYEFYAKVLGRNSIDGRGMQMKSVVHYGRSYNNAYWDGSKMTYGDGDGKLFKPLSLGLDVVGHEMTHGVTEHTAGLAYRNQSGALNESWSDVFGELIEQWAENRQGFGTVDAAKAADWLIGEDVFTPGVDGDGLRSMKAPGTGYKGDPQPGHMKDYKKMSSDNGGVHINSGIPNKAAYEVAIRIGGDKLAKIWYTALTDYLRPNSDFNAAASATLAAATRLFGNGAESQAVMDAWTAVGITAQPGATTKFMASTQAPTVVEHHVTDEDGVVPTWLRDGVVDAKELASFK